MKKMENCFCFNTKKVLFTHAFNTRKSVKKQKHADDDNFKKKFFSAEKNL
jgi:hypothetical protein